MGDSTKLSWIFGTNIPFAYDQHTGNNEDLSIEEQHTESRPAQVKEADVQRAEE